MRHSLYAARRRTARAVMAAQADVQGRLVVLGAGVGIQRAAAPEAAEQTGAERQGPAGAGLPAVIGALMGGGVEPALDLRPQGRVHQRLMGALDGELVARLCPLVAPAGMPVVAQASFIDRVA